jgi:hypothetical protein
MAVPKHLRPQRGLGSAVSAQRRKQRDALRRQRERAEDNARNKAREELQRLGRKDYQPTYAQALIASVADNQTAFMRSMGLRQYITASASYWHDTVSAFTDFRRIVVNYPSKAVKMPDGSNRNATIDTISDLRGIIQHEIGHIRFTVPFPELCDQALQDRGDSAMHRAWNILEDQRMETLVVDAVPRIATYLTKMIYNHIVSGDMDRSWLLLAGRTYLPSDLRSMSHQLFDATLPAPPYGTEPYSKQWYEIVKRYKQADNAVDMYNCVKEAHDFIERVMPNETPNGGTTHQDRYNDRWSDDNSASESSGSCGEACKPEDDPVEDEIGTGGNKPDKQDGSSNEQDGDSGDSGDTASDGDKAGEGSSDADNNGPGNVSNQDVNSRPGGNGVTTGDTRESLKQSIREQIDSELEDIVKKHLADSDNQQMLANANHRMSGDGLPELANTGIQMTAEQLDMSNKIAVGIQQALAELETASQPAWHSRQDAGVLDALAYRTKQVGSLDYHRRLEGDANAGMDLHVSVLSDISGSMSGTNIQHLSIAMYGMRVACDNLGIQSSFTLWSSPGDTGRIWRHSEPMPLIWEANGGTDPTGALDDLMNHNEENSSHHLVVIFTDGMWGGDTDLRRWSAPDRYIMLCILGYHMEYNADATFTLKSCLELPNKMIDAIKQLNIK